MPLETSRPEQSNGEGDKRRHFDKDIKDMVSSITRRVSGIHKSGSSHHHEGVDDGDQHGAGIITIAGNNVGATLRSELDEKSDPQHGISLGDQIDDTSCTYVNSNFQGVNNSILFGSSYNANDPGVHLDISDVVQREGKKKQAVKPRRKGKEKREG